MLGLVMAGIDDRIDKFTVSEAARTMGYDSPETEQPRRPTVRAQAQLLPLPDFEATSRADFMVLGHIMAAMPAMNAIPALVGAPPGIVSYPQLRVPLPRGLVRR